MPKSLGDRRVAMFKAENDAAFAAEQWVEARLELGRAFVQPYEEALEDALQVLRSKRRAYEKAVRRAEKRGEL